MTQEQKAKAYDEALEKARKYRDEEGFTEMEDLFPELAGCEDERIRKVLIHIVKSACSKYGIKYIGDKITEEMLLAYLEKQKPVENSGKELLYVSNKSYNIGYRDGKREAEQKTAEWSEDDERIRAKLLSYFNEFVESTSFGRREVIEIRHWLKSLRPTQWKPSEEHLSALLAIISDPNNIGSQTCQLALTDLYEQLKKL